MPNVRSQIIVWTIDIEQPFDNKESLNELKVIVKLENLAIATFGNFTITMEEGVKYANHIDPKTGFSTKNSLLSA